MSKIKRHFALPNFYIKSAGNNGSPFQRETLDIHRSSHNIRAQSDCAGMLIGSDSDHVWECGMGKSGKQDWGRVRQVFKNTLPENAEFNRVDCLNLLMFLAHNPNEGLLLQDLELRLPDLGSKVESIVSKLVALGLVKSSLQRGTLLSPMAIDLMSAPPKEEAE